MKRGLAIVSLTPGTTLREYKILGRVRRDEGRGDLYAARHCLLSTALAVRQLPRDLLAEPATKDWVLREARVFAEFDHPSVARVVDCFEEDGCLHVVYGLIDGILLAEILKRGPLPPSQAARLALTIGEALNAAHSHRWRLGETWETGIPHGDLRPSSVVVGCDGRVKILDFSPLGSVRSPAGDRRALGLLMALMLMGTVEWNDEDYPQRLPALPRSYQELLEKLVGPDAAAEPPEFSEFLPTLWEICQAYDEGGLVPRCSLDLIGNVAEPKALSSNPAHKRLFVGDCRRKSLSQYRFDGGFEEKLEGFTHRPSGLCWMPGYGLFVAGASSGSLSVFTADAPVDFTVEGLEPGPNTSESSDTFVGMTRVDRSLMAMADVPNRRVILVDPAGTCAGAFGSEGTEDGQFLLPSGIACFRNELVVCDTERNDLQYFSSEGAFLRRRAGSDDGLTSPTGCDFDPLGNLYVADRDTGRLLILEPDGDRIEFDVLAVGVGVIEKPQDVHITEGGCLIAVSDTEQRMVFLFDNYFYLAGAEAAGKCTDCGFINPLGVGRCLVCQELERSFAVQQTAEEGAETNELDSFDEQSDLEQEMLLKGFIQAGEAKRAIEPLRRRLAESPNDEEAFSLLAEAYRSCHEIDPLAAIELLRRCDGDARAAYLLSSMFVGLKTQGPAKKYLNVFLHLGGAEELAGELNSYVSELVTSGTLRPESSRFFLRLSGLLEVEGRIDEALYFYSHYVELDPDDYGTRTSLGRLLLREHRFDEAEEQYRWMFERNPYDVEALEIITSLGNRRKDFEAVREQLKVFFNDPQIGDRLIAGHGKVRYNYAVALAQLGDGDYAKRELGRSRRLGFKPLAPEKFKAFSDRYKDHDYAKAVQAGDELCLEFELFKWPAADVSRSFMWKMADCYERLKDYDRAVRCYRAFANEFPTNPSAVKANTKIVALAQKMASR